MYSLTTTDLLEGCGEGVVHLTSPGRPTDIGFQLGKACYSCRVRVEGGGMFFTSSVSSLSLLFLFLPCPSLLTPTISAISFLPFSGRRHKMTHKG